MNTSAQLTITCSNSTIQTLEKDIKFARRRRSGVFIVNFEHVSQLFLVFLLLTFNKLMLQVSNS